jgi:hypothetical protein
MSDLPPGSPPPYKSPDGVPFIYFDLAPAYGVMNGAIQIELGSRILVPALNDAGVTTEFATTAHLRCSPQAASYLREAIDKALSMLAQPQEAPVQAAKLN